MDRLSLDEPRVYRRVGIPVSAFDVLCALKRAWRMPTNADVLTRLLLHHAPQVGPMKNDDDASAADRIQPRR